MSKQKKQLSPSTSPKSLFITLLLLITGLLFSSLLLFHYRTTHSDLHPSVENLKTAIGKKATLISSNLWSAAKGDNDEESKPKRRSKADKENPYKLTDLFSEQNEEENVLKVDALIQSDNQKPSFAIINGIRYLEGETKNDITVIKILTDQNVQVKYKGETKTLHLGENPEK